MARALTFMLTWKYLLFFALAVAGLVLLARSRRMRRSRLALQAVAFVLFGGVLALALPWAARELGLHPSPVCAVAKGTAAAIQRGFVPPPQLAMVLFAVGLTLVGGKAFCGWACPLGALQELVGRIPGLRRLRLPFALTNTVRVAAFAVFLGLLLTSGVIAYDWFNPFEALHWTDLGHVAVWLPLAVVLGASLFVYRPFCAFLCPLGLLTWVVEQASPGRVRVTSECDGCNACLKKTDCQALPAIVAGRSLIPDCHGCGDCLGTCKRGFLSFGWRAPRTLPVLSPREPANGPSA